MIQIEPVRKIVLQVFAWISGAFFAMMVLVSNGWPVPQPWRTAIALAFWIFWPLVLSVFLPISFGLLFYTLYVVYVRPRLPLRKRRHQPAGSMGD